MALINREQALSHPFANGQYDKEHADEHFIMGFEDYKEWLEDLPTVEAIPRECIEQMVAEIEKLKTNIEAQDIPFSRFYAAGMEQALEVIHKYTKEQVDNTRPYYANEWL